MRGLISVTVLALPIAVNAQIQAWGQCGGGSYSGDATCVSGYYCNTGNEYYRQCVPGDDPNASVPSSDPSTASGSSNSSPPAEVTPSSTIPAASSGDSATATGPGTTLQSGWLWIRAVAAPNFHKYLQTKPQLTEGTAIMDSYTTAGQFQVTDGQVVQLVSAPGATPSYLYLNVAPGASGDTKLATSFKSTKNALGTFVFSGDALTWSAPDVKRQQNNAWLVCANQQLFLNLGAYGYQTPSGCADQTIHFYNDSHANGKREDDEAAAEE